MSHHEGPFRIPENFGDRRVEIGDDPVRSSSMTGLGLIFGERGEVAGVRFQALALGDVDEGSPLPRRYSPGRAVGKGAGQKVPVPLVGRHLALMPAPPASTRCIS